MVFVSSCSLYRRFINRTVPHFHRGLHTNLRFINSTALPLWASYKPAEFSAHFRKLPAELMPWLFEKPDKSEPSQSSAWTHPRRPDLIRKTRENQVISISSPDLSSVSYFIDIAFIFFCQGGHSPAVETRAYKQLYFTGLLCSGWLSASFSAYYGLYHSLYSSHTHTHILYPITSPRLNVSSVNDCHLLVSKHIQNIVDIQALALHRFTVQAKVFYHAECWGIFVNLLYLFRECKLFAGGFLKAALHLLLLMCKSPCSVLPPLPIDAEQQPVRLCFHAYTLCSAPLRPPL